MTAWNWVVVAFTVVAILAWFGAWVEVFLMLSFHQPYFATGPLVLERTAALRRMKRGCDLLVPDPNLPEFAARRISPTTVLLRRTTIFGPLRFAVPPVWSERMELRAEDHAGVCTLRLQVRHGLCWPVFLALPALGVTIGLARSPCWQLLLAFAVCLLAAVLPIVRSVRVARRDAARVWDAVTGAWGK